MPTLIRIGNRLVNIDQVRSITHYETDGSFRIFFNDAGTDESAVNFLDFLHEQAKALAYYLQSFDDLIAIYRIDHGRCGKCNHDLRDYGSDALCPDCDADYIQSNYPPDNAQSAKVD